MCRLRWVPVCEGLQRAGRWFTGLSPGAAWGRARPGPGRGGRRSAYLEIVIKSKGVLGLTGHVQRPRTRRVKMLTL